MSLKIEQHKINAKNRESKEIETNIAKAHYLIKGLDPILAGRVLWDERFPTRIIAYVLKLDSPDDFRAIVSPCLTDDEILNTTTTKRVSMFERMGYNRRHGRIKWSMLAANAFQDIAFYGQ